MNRTFVRPALVLTLAAALAGATAQPAAAAPRRSAKTVKAVRPVRYVVVGTFASTDGTTLTLAPTTGGNARTKPAPVTVAVSPTAVVIRDDVAATLADLVAGDHVAASGTRTGTSVTVTKVIATSPEPVVVEPVVV